MRSPLHDAFPLASSTSFAYRGKKKPVRPIEVIVWDDDDYLPIADPASWTAVSAAAPPGTTYIATTGRNGGGGDDSALLLEFGHLKVARTMFVEPHEQWRVGDDWGLTASAWRTADGLPHLILFEVLC